MPVGKRLESARVSRGLTDVKALAEKAGVAYGYWYEVERGDANPTIEWLTKAANAIGISISDLLTGEVRSTAMTS